MQTYVYLSIKRLYTIRLVTQCLDIFHEQYFTGQKKTSDLVAIHNLRTIQLIIHSMTTSKFVYKEVSLAKE